MDWNVKLVDLVGWGIGIVGVFMAIYQNYKSRKIRDFIRSESWATYARTNDITGKVQKNLGIYRQKHSDCIDPDVIEFLTRSDALVLELFYDSIRQIKNSEPEFSTSTIDFWKKSGKIDDAHMKNFRQIVVGDEPRSSCLETFCRVCYSQRRLFSLLFLLFLVSLLFCIPY